MSTLRMTYVWRKWLEILIYIRCKKIVGLLRSALYFSFFHFEECNISEEHYHTTILKAVQSIFAHLLGSEMQFYSPNFFWKHFRLVKNISFFWELSKLLKLIGLQILRWSSECSGAAGCIGVLQRSVWLHRRRLKEAGRTAHLWEFIWWNVCWSEDLQGLST